MAAAWQQKIAEQGFVGYLKVQRVADRELARILREAAIEAERLVISIVPDNPSAAVRRAQFAQRSEVLWQQQAQMWGRIDDATTQGIRRSTALAAESNAAVVNHLTATASKQVLDLAENMRFAAQRGASVVRARLLNDIDLSPRVYKNQALSRKKVQRAVNNGLANGKSAKEIAKDVRKFIRPDVPGGTSYAAQRLGRTEINNAWHAMNVQAVQDEPWVTGIQWNTSGSHPRPDVCNEYADEDHDGLGRGIFKKGNVPSKPHPQCLCFTTVISIDDDEFLDNLAGGRYDKFMNSQGFF